MLLPRKPAGVPLKKPDPLTDYLTALRLLAMAEVATGLASEDYVRAESHAWEIYNRLPEEILAVVTPPTAPISELGL